MKRKLTDEQIAQITSTLSEIIGTYGWETIARDVRHETDVRQIGRYGAFAVGAVARAGKLEEARELRHKLLLLGVIA